MKTSFIYIITDGQNNFKVGVSKKDPKMRMLELQTGNAQKLEILSVFEVPSEIVFKLEKESHRRIQEKFPKRGEWFKNAHGWYLNLIVDSVCMNYLVK